MSEIGQVIKFIIIVKLIIEYYISHSLNFRLYWFSIVFQTFDGVKGMLLHLVNARFSVPLLGFALQLLLVLFLLGRQVLFSLFIIVILTLKTIYQFTDDTVK
ncbi:Hypothetical_protein [Hexamita inflata]|uniref:Hypothetical_protein n=1 Tax=Hexamita inflata TaxID=28002 RepID=A0AA86N4X9_9EUKA|nr:Hypothetical protein HINF_LOCUS565 [Hexamita inflata]